jgi:hypothetical protein
MLCDKPARLTCHANFEGTNLHNQYIRTRTNTQTCTIWKYNSGSSLLRQFTLPSFMSYLALNENIKNIGPARVGSYTR